jgi:hypothetical protein
VTNSARPAPSLQDLSDPAGRRTLLAEDEPIGGARSDRPSHGKLSQVPLGIGVPGVQPIVGPAVELDDKAVLLVPDVLICTSPGRPTGPLAACNRQSVGSLDAVAVPALEDRAQSLL